MTVKPYDEERPKKAQVRDMFDRIAPRYDLLNHTLSFNIDRLWRRRVVRLVRRHGARRILDLATGTGDLAIELARRIPGSQVLGIDLSEQMLEGKVTTGKKYICKAENGEFVFAEQTEPESAENE